MPAFPMVSSVVIGLIALLHVYILVLEIFLWDKPTGCKTFGHSVETAQRTKVLAANQGVYNGFLAAGLVWGLYLGADGFAIKVFFLGCILVAGIYGGITAKLKIIYLQALPALLGLALLFLHW